MTLKQFIQSASAIINDKAPGTKMGVDRINLFLQLTNLDYFKLWTGLPEQWQPGQPITTRGWQVSMANTEALEPFIVYVNDQTIDVNGKITLPGDYVHYSDIMYLYVEDTKSYFVPVEPVTHAELSDRLSNAITAPEDRYPICIFYNNYIQTYPKDLMNVDFTYLRLPTTPGYAVQQLNGIDVYDPVNSVEFEWKEAYHADLLRIFIGYLAPSLKDMNLTNFIETKKAQGV